MVPRGLAPVRLDPFSGHASRVHRRHAHALEDGRRRRQLLHALSAGRSVHILWHGRRGPQHVDEHGELRAGHGAASNLPISGLATPLGISTLTFRVPTP